MNNARNLTLEKERSAKALEKYLLITPLLDETLDAASARQKRLKLAEDHDISERTLRRYVNAFRKDGFDGLKPVERVRYRKSVLPENYEELLQEAIQLRREVPQRSVKQIITILEMEERVEPGALSRPTLQRHLYQAGFGTVHMEIYKDTRKSSSKRFCKPHRMMLIQGDIKYGPRLPIGKNGRKMQTYLSSAIDDHSRFVLASEFYDNQEEAVVSDTFRKVILKYGRFDRAYFDNGSQYRAKQLKLSLAKLSIKISHAPVESGKSKGKIEKFHQVVNAFIAEAEAKKIHSLEELNRYWQIYLDEYYHNDRHDGISEYYETHGITVPPEGISPRQEFNRDTRTLTFLDAAAVGEAFLYHELRKVDKGACIRFKGRRYETKAQLIGCKVEIAYDPANPGIIMVYAAGMEPFQAQPLEMREYCDQQSSLPPYTKTIEPETSRFLDALEKQHERNSKRKADAISFGGYRKEVNSDV